MCLNFSKLALVCIPYHCGAWYAFHTIAEMVWHHTLLPYQQKGSDFDGFMTLKEGNLWYKFEGPSCYGNRVVYPFHFCNGMKRMLCNGMKCIPVLILKSQRQTFSQTINFFSNQ